MAAARRIRWLWLILVVLAVLVADQAAKYAIERFTGPDYIRVLIPGFLTLVHTHNPGVAFGLLADAHSPWLRAFLILFSIAVMVFLLYLLSAGKAGGRMGQVGMALILGGAAGNAFDRLLHQGVTDFVDLHLRAHHWPAFNLADSAIVVGAALVLLELVADWRHPREGNT